MPEQRVITDLAVCGTEMESDGIRESLFGHLGFQLSFCH